MVIPGLPVELLTDTQIKTIDETAKSIEQYSMLLAVLFSMFGIWFSQYRYIASLTGGPGKYTGRICIVLIALTLYKYLIWFILSIGLFLSGAIAEATNVKVYPWQPSTYLTGKVDYNVVEMCKKLLNKIETNPQLANDNKEVIEQYKNQCNLIIQDSEKENSNLSNNTSSEKKDESKNSILGSIIDQIGKIIQIIIWNPPGTFLLKFFPLVFTSIVLNIVNTIVFFSMIILYYFWLLFIILLYITAPILITAGLLPSIGEKMLSRWFYSLVQCSLWCPILSFASILILGFQTTYIDKFLINVVDYLLQSTDQALIESITSSITLIAFNIAFVIFVVKTPFMVAKIVPEALILSVVGLMMSKTIVPALKTTAKVVDNTAKAIEMVATIVASILGTPALGKIVTITSKVASTAIIYPLDKTAELFDESGRYAESTLLNRIYKENLKNTKNKTNKENERTTTENTAITDDKNTANKINTKGKIENNTKSTSESIVSRANTGITPKSIVGRTNTGSVSRSTTSTTDTGSVSGSTTDTTRSK